MAAFFFNGSANIVGKTWKNCQAYGPFFTSALGKIGSSTEGGNKNDSKLEKKKAIG